jgi:Fe-S cluster biogenesis protein NfuA
MTSTVSPSGLIPVNVYAESTPNPAAMKFVSSILLLPDGVVEFGSADEAVSCPLAAQLFKFTGVKSVFITSNFITVTKESDIEWYEIMNILREFIRGHLMTGEKLFISDPFAVSTVAATVDDMPGKSVPAAEAAAAVGPGSDAINEQIISMLDEYVKPAVEQDGGAIEFRSFHNGVVTVALKGSCSGCPSSTMTLKSGIENLLKKMIPGVEEVVAESE